MAGLLGDLSTEALLALHADLAKYSEDQPREPAGSPEGGRFAGGASRDSIDALPPGRRARVTAAMDRLRATFPGHGDVRVQMATTDPEGRANVSAYADQSTQTINLISSQWKGTTVGGRRGEEWTAAPGPEGVVAHEFGHLVAGWIQSPPPGTPVNFKAWNLVDRLSSRGWSDIASSYGAMGDPGENWAEWFSAAYTPGGPKYDAPQAQEIRSVLSVAGITKFNPNHDERGRFASGSGLALGDGQPYGAPLNPDQRAALLSYTEEISNVNSWLRNGLREPHFAGADDQMRANAARDAKIIASAARPLPTRMTLLRGVSAMDLGAPEDAGMSQIDRHMHSLVGTVLRDKGFMGTTTDPGIRYYRDAEVHLHIDTPAGTPVVQIEDVVGRYHEAERLLPPGSGIAVSRVSMSNDGAGDHWDVYGKYVP